MSTGPTHPLEHVMENMPDNSKKVLKAQSRVIRKTVAARTKAIKKGRPLPFGRRPGDP